MWVNILFYFTFNVKWLFYLCQVLVGSLKEKWGEDLGSWIHIISTPTRQLEWPTLIIFMLSFILEWDYLVYLPIHVGWTLRIPCKNLKTCVFANPTCSSQFMILRMRQILMTSKDLACKRLAASALVAYANHPGFGLIPCEPCWLSVRMGCVGVGIWTPSSMGCTQG